MNSLLIQNQTTMKSKDEKYIFVAIIALIFAACSEKVSEKAFISPPFPQFDIAYTDFQFEAEKGDTLLYSSGTKIIVPPDIWVDSEGNKVSGNIKIKYREFANAADVFLAGIPMAYDTAGKRETLVTAGMFEIRSYREAQEVFIAKDKSLQVQMASFVDDPDYNFYTLDENAKNWQYKGSERPVENPRRREIADSIELIKPKMPFPFDESYFALNYMSILDVYFKDNYQLIYKNRSSKAPKTKAEEYGLKWSGIYPSYEIMFNGIRYSTHQIVWQTVSGKKLPGFASEAYVDNLRNLGNNTYNMEIAYGNKKSTIRVKAVMPIKQLFAFPAETWQKNYDDVMAKIKQEEERLAAQFAVYRTFEVNTTGFHNWDKVYSRTDKVLVKGDFKFDKKIEGDLGDIEIYYFVEDNKSFIKFPHSAADSLMLVPDNTAKFIAVLSATEAAVFSSAEYNKLNFDQLKSNPVYTFNMKTVAINSKDDFMHLVKNN
jgi:hypothetical protein